ncbi:SH3 domain-containing protein [Leptospira bouyouniensis]|uniref:SH3 domain-containing protein n=1 Tax=Leptospira bouyouniensis TaxID=2484911 RepID=A0A7I0IUA8_9LEPT|nr:SH3 domain-containing protein [Leptospira bouyouniensis]TGL09137.1 SH3 domain-containing protein [Leptospira bouyouniensis]
MNKYSNILFFFCFSVLTCKESIDIKRNESKYKSESDILLLKRMPSLYDLSFIESKIDQPCYHFYQYFGLIGKPEITIKKGNEYCFFDFNGMKVSIETKYKGTDYWFIQLELNHIKSKIKKLLTIAIDLQKIRYITSTNHCYEYGYYTDKYSDNAPGWQYVPCGASKKLIFKAGILDKGELYCYQNYNDGLELEKQYKVNDLVYECGKFFSFEGNQIIEQENPNVTEKKYTCGNECFDFIPYLRKGEYLIRKPNTILRSKPTRKSEILAKYNTDDTLEVLEDVGNIEKISFQVAPWVRVRMFDGKEGFIYGALLKQEGEFWPPY